MSDITLPHPTFTDGNTIVADDVWENLYSTPLLPNSYEVINGGLEVANLVSPTLSTLTTEVIRAGSLSGGRGVGATSNLDYFNNAFSDWVSDPDSDATGDVDDFYQPIPGASVSFYLPYAADALFLFWRIKTVHLVTANVGEFPSVIRLFVDGARVANVNQEIPYAQAALVGRDWAGHYLKTSGLAKGWHSASLRIAVTGSSAAATHIRIQVRNFNHVYFR